MTGLGALDRRLWSYRHSIRVRLTLWYLLVLTVILLAFSGFLYLSLARGLQTEADSRLTILTQQVLTVLEIDDDQLEQPTHLEDLPAEAVVALYDRRGRLLYSADPIGVLPALDRAAVQAVGLPWQFTTRTAADGGTWRMVSVPVFDDGAPVGALLVAHSEQEMVATLRRLLTLLGIAIPVTLLLTSAGGLFLAGRALGPIDRLTRLAQAITADDLSRRLTVSPVEDEVGRLARTLNSMLDRLARAFQRQRQFTADASHELRTPLAMLAAQADVMLERPHSAAEHRQALVSMREDIGRMSRLVSELLTLARADAGREALNSERLALETLVETVATTMAPLAEARGIDLVVATNGSVPVAGDQTRLTQLAVNLVDNALKHTPAGGRVTLAAGQEARQAVLRVVDTGEGIAPEHLPHVFERFYRADPARASAEGGTGLGLAICRWIAEAHGGQIAIDSVRGAGTTVTVRLPQRG